MAAWRVWLVSTVLCGALALPNAQDLGGAGTVRGVVKDPNGGVLVAAKVTIANPVSGFSRVGATDSVGAFVFRNLPPNAYRLDHHGDGIQGGHERRQGRERRADRSRCDDACARRSLDRRRGVGVHVRRAVVHRAHRHRSDRRRAAPGRVAVRSESGDYPGGARRRRRCERVLSPDWRPRPDAVRDRQPACHRSAEPAVLEPDLTGRGPVDGGHHRRGASRVRRQDAVSSSKSPPSRASTS